MTGSEAKIGKHVGARYTAWDGYISGKTLELAAGRRIVQSWRTTEFEATDPDSTIVVDLEPTKTGTRLTLDAPRRARRSDELRKRRLARFLFRADASVFRE